ncbi:hypothetical protein [Lentilactobacillus hilgardii]|uniref:hypothetical protein n=1 Tax=Lentilactobacillus hilgardii TaxID=1588 RepID=UPI0021C42ADB|nr:hypothetical protein [Lentilactobacillus hilgardii]MCP9333876.1 hypothetical protein [Lentilactobacillus hilgardii]MCP9350466.1 hypothetical protein [Lentilactobacillus hilgardii]MCP9353371.1 hypothetical protein [Lentilactobacillus hilgardii]
MKKSQLSDQINEAFIAFNREASHHADNTYVARLDNNGVVSVIAIPYGDPHKPYLIPQDFSKLLNDVADKAYAAETGAFSQLKALELEILKQGVEE